MLKGQKKKVNPYNPNTEFDLPIAEQPLLASSAYRGNTHLRPAGIPVEMTPQQMQEYIRCFNDINYFVERYIKIIHVDKGLISFNPYKYQTKMMKTFANQRFAVVKAPRQCGKTTAVTGFIVWSLLFKPSYAMGVMANKMPMAQGVITWNKRSLELENNSSIFAAPTTPAGLRSKSLSAILLDEFAHVPRNIQTAFFTSTYPVITSGTETKVIMISTPNGIEMFSKTWLDAIAKKNDYKPLEINWWDTPGRDQAWKEETIRNTSKEQFRVEFECQIVGSTNTLIDPNTLTSLRSSEPIRKTEDIRIYAEPTPKHVYMLVADSARGVGGDYSAFVVIDITTMPYTISATYRDNTIKPVQFPNYIAHAAQIYNNAYVLPENNDIGGQIVDMLIA